LITTPLRLPFDYYFYFSACVGGTSERAGSTHLSLAS
jgi:hypothetical protein